jgi:hypothetical protein
MEIPMPQVPKLAYVVLAPPKPALRTLFPAILSGVSLAWPASPPITRMP